MRLIVLVVFFVVANMSIAQTSVESSSLLRTLSGSLSLEINGASMMGNREYGHLGSASVGLRLVSLPKTVLSGFLFSGDLSVWGSVGLGRRSMVGGSRDPFSMGVLSAGFQMPVINFSPLFRTQRDVVFHVRPFYEHSLMRNPGTGHTSRLVGLGTSAGLTVHLTEYLALTGGVSRVWNRPSSARFLWNARYETFGVGVIIRLGDILEGVHTQRSVNRGLENENVKLRQTVEQMRTEKGHLFSRDQSLRDSLRNALVALGELENEAEELKRANAIQRTVVKNAPSLVHFDESQRAPTRVIRIDKMLFDREDLLEEDYLKAILSILTNYDSYAWEIAYRDSVNAQGVEGEHLAQKIKSFFEIYNSKLKRKVRIVLDSGMKPEFEIRCLGREIAHAGDSAQN